MASAPLLDGGLVEKTVVADDGATLKYYELPGAHADAPTLITTAGFGGPGAAKAFGELSKTAGVRVIGFCFRGFAENPVGTGSPLTVERCARDLHAVLKAEATPARRAALLGNSLGANVIWRLADLFGEELVDRYIFVDQPVFVRQLFKGKPAIPAMCCFLNVARCLKAVICCFRPCCCSGFFAMDFAAFGNLVEDSETTDNTERLARVVSRPCLVYGGEASFVPGALDNARRVASLVRGPSRVLLYPKPYGTHSPQGDEKTGGATRFRADVLAYLQVPEVEFSKDAKGAEMKEVSGGADAAVPLQSKF